MSKSIPCICVDAKHRPAKIPESKWPKKGEEYHVNHVFIMHIQDGIKGCELSEFDISMHAPYNCYRLSRFAFTQEDLIKLISLIEECAKLNGVPDIDINKITREIPIKK
jgi:hypothetical protein